MNTIKSLGLAGLAAAALLAFPAFATPVTCPAGFQGSPTCIATSNGFGEPTLAQLLGPAGTPDSIFSSGPGVDPYTQQVQTPFWAVDASSGSVASVLLQLTSGQNNFTYGIFDPTDPNNKLALFTDAHNGAQVTLSVYVNGGYSVDGGNTIDHFGTPTHFGYYLMTSNGTTFYSLPTLNGNGDTRMVAFEGTDGPNQSVVAPGVGGSGLRGGPFVSNEFIQGWEDGGDFDYQDYVVLVSDVRPVPEPAALGMFGLGVLLIGGFVVLRRRREGTA
ncbi:MAG TPA: PEP-CTERM sorting domain-containing protein [Rhodanobacteraceae bacterium]